MQVECDGLLKSFEIPLPEKKVKMDKGKIKRLMSADIS
jgi:hypothetical protein